MTTSHMDQNNVQHLALIETIIESRVRLASQEQVIDDYEDILNVIWNRIMPTLGGVTLVAIIERSIVITTRSYPQIRPLHVTTKGFDLDELRQQAQACPISTLHQALKAFIMKLTEILITLTGDILVGQLIRHFETRPTNGGGTQ